MPDSAPAQGDAQRARWGMPKRWVWLQLILGWLPIWALYSVLILTAHPGTTLHSAFFAGMRAIVCAALVGFAVNRLTQRVRWPVPMRLSFVAIQLMAAMAFALIWIALITVLEGSMVAMHGGAMRFAVRGPFLSFVVIGVWMYLMVAAVIYASQAAQRAVIAESLAVTSQLSTLRAQLNPHFLFNALHTVVQLIPLDPSRATKAAEQLATLLRASLEETRDLVPLRDEWAFVSRYLDLELIRFGDRLHIDSQLDARVIGAMIPSFALQTLVENAVRHGAAPHVDTTTLTIRAREEKGMLSVRVCDTGVGADLSSSGSRGTGLARLRDRLRVLYGDRGRLSLESAVGSGFCATIEFPHLEGERT